MSTPTIRDHCVALTNGVDYLLACIRDGDSDPVALQECADHMHAARDALKAGEAEPSDTEDARLFRLWIREASERPGRLARSICPCITPDQYRDVLRGFATATDIEDALHGGHQTIQEEQ